MLTLPGGTRSKRSLAAIRSAVVLDGSVFKMYFISSLLIVTEKVQFSPMTYLVLRGT